MDKGYFETFAKKLCDFVMKKYVIPYLQDHGVIQSYRATVMAKDTINRTMTVKRPFDTPVIIPYSDGVGTLSAGDSCDDDRRRYLIAGIVLNHEDRSCTALFAPDYGGQVGIVDIVFVNRHMSFTS